MFVRNRLFIKSKAITEPALDVVEVERHSLARHALAAQPVLRVHGLARLDEGVGVVLDGGEADPDGEGLHVAAAAEAAEVEDHAIDLQV